MKITPFAICLLYLLLTSCATPPDEGVANVPVTHFSHQLSRFPVPVAYDSYIEGEDGKPDWYIYRTLEPIIQNNSIIVPSGTYLGAVQYYRETPHLTISYIRLPDQSPWTPAQGVISRQLGGGGTATLSHAAVQDVDGKYLLEDHFHPLPDNQQTTRTISLPGGK